MLPRRIVEIAWEKEKEEEAAADGHMKEKTVIVLLWTPLNGHYGNWERHLGAGYNAFAERCPDRGGKRCVFTDDRDMLIGSDLVIFSINDLRDHLYEDRDVWAVKELPPMKKRPPEQRWALFWRDSPLKVKISSGKLSWLDGVFNWTISYRQDADVFYPFGMFRV